MFESSVRPNTGRRSNREVGTKEVHTTESTSTYGYLPTYILLISPVRVQVKFVCVYMWETCVVLQV